MTDKAVEEFTIDPEDIYYGENLLDDWNEMCPDWATQCNELEKDADEKDDED